MIIALLGLAPLQSLGLREMILQRYPHTEVIISDGASANEADNWPDAERYVVSSAAMAAYARHLMPRLSEVMLLTSSRPVSAGRNSLPCLSPLASEAEIWHALDNFIHGHTQPPHHHAPAAVATDNNELKLTARELDVLKETVMGRSVKEIAAKLNISVNTVLTHRKNLAEKTGVHSAPALVYFAMKHKLV